MKTDPPASPAVPGARDWIVAPATGAGPSAIAIVRLDGPGCWQAASKVWAPGAAASDAPDGAKVGDAQPATVEQPPPAVSVARPPSAADSQESEGQPREAPPPPPRRLTRGLVRDASGAPADEAFVAWFPAPHSYTGNDLVEFHCHGSPAVVAALIDALREAGARMARPGEFTERAFFNGRIDLAQAEGVANLIASRTRAAGRAALSQLRGVLSKEVRAIRETLTDLAAEIEARLDFPEEEIGAEGAEKDWRFRQAGLESFAEARKRLDALTATARRGRLLRDGARVVVAGKPNTGKSSLFNGLVGRERALVTPHPGTTRDTIEATLDVRGIPIVLIDTAGVRQDSHDEIETLGIERAKSEVECADLVVLVIDGSYPVDSEDVRLFESLADSRTSSATPRIVAANKSDLPAAQDDAALIQALTDAGRIETERGAPGSVEQPPSAVSEEGEGEKTRERRLRSEPETPLLRVCALRPATLGPLEALVADALLGEEGAAAASDGATVTNLRHEELLRRALDALGRARHSFAESASGEFTMIDLRDALDSLGEIIGETVDDAILSRIFSKFCVGK